YGLVGGRFMDPALCIDARVNAGDMTAGRHRLQAVASRILNLRGRVENLYPGKVEGGIVGVVRQNIGGIRRVEQRRVENPGRFDCLMAVEDRKAVLRLLPTVRVD